MNAPTPSTGNTHGAGSGNLCCKRRFIVRAWFQARRAGSSQIRQNKHCETTPNVCLPSYLLAPRLKFVRLALAGNLAAEADHLNPHGLARPRATPFRERIGKRKIAKAVATSTTNRHPTNRVTQRTSTAGTIVHAPGWCAYSLGQAHARVRQLKKCENRHTHALH